jgi:hypothetical protein
MPTLQHTTASIKQQIGVSTLMCIGAHNFQTVTDEKKGYGGVKFDLGTNPKLGVGGTVTVFLDYMDTYTVTITNGKGEKVYEQSDVYFDMLPGPDGVIERVTG